MSVGSVNPNKYLHPDYKYWYREQNKADGVSFPDTYWQDICLKLQGKTAGIFDLFGVCGIENTTSKQMNNVSLYA